MLKRMLRLQPRVPTSDPSRGLEYGSCGLQERTGTRLSADQPKPRDLEAARRVQAGRDPATSRQGPRPRDQPRIPEAAGPQPDRTRRDRGGTRPGKSDGEAPPRATPLTATGQQHETALVVIAVRGVIECCTSLRGVCGWLALTMHLALCPE